LALSALSLSHPAIKNLLARSLLSTWSFGAYISNKESHKVEVLLKIYLSITGQRVGDKKREKQFLFSMQEMGAKT
jgi:hypothetical protein